MPGRPRFDCVSARPALPVFILSLHHPSFECARRVLGAYQYVPAHAAFTYRPPSGAAAPDPAALGAEEGLLASQRMRQATRGGASRRLIEGWPGAEAMVAAMQQQQAAGQQPRWRRRRQLRAAAAAEEREEEQEQEQQREAPPAGSYAAALLAAFDDDAARAAHTAAWRARGEAMRRNVGTAQQILRETAAWADSAAGVAEEQEWPID